MLFNFSPLAQAIPFQQSTPPDTVVADTVSLAQRFRADSTIQRLADPTTFSDFFGALREGLLDAALWIGLVGVLVQIVLILFLAWLAIRVIDKVSKRSTRRFEDLPKSHPRRQRAFTISNLLSSSARYIVWPVAIIMVLDQLEVDVAALVATAGIAGLAFGFGAQTLVKDVISGIFLLFDDTIHVGDLVRLGSDSGTVEHIGVRLIKVRKFDGELMMVPAGDLRVFGNKSIVFARAIVEVGLSYEQDLDTILPVMQRVANAWAAERKEILLEEVPLVQAIMNFTDSAILVRVAIQVVPGEQFPAERDLRLQLKRTFDELGIEIPFPRRTLYVRTEDQGALPPRTITDPHAPLPEKDDALESD